MIYSGFCWFVHLNPFKVCQIPIQTTLLTYVFTKVSQKQSKNHIFRLFAKMRLSQKTSRWNSKITVICSSFCPYTRLNSSRVCQIPIQTTFTNICLHKSVRETVEKSHFLFSWRFRGVLAEIPKFGLRAKLSPWILLIQSLANKKKDSPCLEEQFILICAFIKVAWKLSYVSFCCFCGFSKMTISNQPSWLKNHSNFFSAALIALQKKNPPNTFWFGTFFSMEASIGQL